MSEEVVGSIVMSVNGDDYDCAKFTSSTTTGTKPVPTMNRKQRIKYVAMGIRTFKLTASVVVPDGKDTVKWLDVKDGRISIESPSGNYRETFIDCHVESVSASYDMNGETLRDLEMFCLDYLDETL
ncbi:hypothetical protein [Acinetobacter gerneri]|uniref:Phage tail protein n=1 Tax=Acinetobacter gerneri DSM 14967 = CIP 107464 = MTCC 9824 TaxID=1120926 RepID=N8ZQ90_9GAMM|nr:hypothetical protein [Acinetobacter gerneri]ENV33918.1 hypothetical protein F960_01924 [Acinetobacter gerneri DSM 14967 = CIP 107464 = MTCC 9824]EPR82795.1 Transaldolase [Acinetobacter gerneri DSM 14967 = CIP 107464 = MTCC 9824]